MVWVVSVSLCKSTGLLWFLWGFYGVFGGLRCGLGVVVGRDERKVGGKRWFEGSQGLATVYRGV